MKRRLIILLAIVLMLSVAGCGGNDVNNIIDRGDTEEEFIPKTGIIIGTTGLNGRFSPFFTMRGNGEGISSGDADVMSVINAPLVTLNRYGEVVFNAATGEESNLAVSEEYLYQGISDVSVSMSGENTTVISFDLRDGVMFSDGEPLDADDVIFTLYVLCDVDYKSAAFSELSFLPIEGLEYYRADADKETYDKYEEIFDDCLIIMKDSEGEYELEDFGIEREQYELFLRCYDEAWRYHVDNIIGYCAENYASYADLIGAGDIDSDEWLRVALAMLVWRIADFEVISPQTAEADAVYGDFTAPASGRKWDMTSRFPTAADFFNELYELYKGDLDAYINAERIGVAGLDDVWREAKRLFISYSAADDDDNTGASSISGIRKTGERSVEVTLTGQVPQAVYSFVIPVAPLHYYGDLSLYSYARSRFGFTRGNISHIRRRSNQPLGAGPYVLEKFDGQTAELTANEYYFKGLPETAEICFKEMSQSDLVFNVATGEADIAAVTASRDILDEIIAYSAAGSFRREADYGAFGYIGINPYKVYISDAEYDEEEEEYEKTEIKPMSEESKNLRKGIAVILAAYREISVEDFYGESADVAEYPVSGVSWASVRHDEQSLEEAFSEDINGNKIYSIDMTESRRIDAAKKAALGFFEAAGCELNASRTAVTNFPSNSPRSFKVYINGYETGRHPSYLLLTMAAETLEAMGIKIEITDVLSQGELFEAVYSGEADIWCAAWNGEVLPRLERRFGSGGEENLFKLSDEMTDQRITLAEASLNTELYQNAYEVILDSAVCVPVYQRKAYFLFGRALDEATVAEDLSTHYSWADVLWKIKIK